MIAKLFLVDSMPVRDKQIVLFLGAGASSVASLPTVKEFFEHVHWGQGEGFHEACKEIARLISIREGSQENLAWPKYDAEKFLAKLQNAVETEEITGKTAEIELSRLSGAKVAAASLLAHLRNELVRIYGRTGRVKPSVEGRHHEKLLNLIDGRTPDKKPIEIFTTNYDLLIENFLDDATFRGKAFGPRPKLCTGFSEGTPRRWKPDLFQESLGPERKINLYKLHGSAGWKWDFPEGTREPVDTGWLQPAGELDCVFYFGYKGIPDDEPFGTLHNRLQRAVLEPVTVITIGFRFGDAYIRSIFEIALRANPELRVLCCLRSEPEKNSPVSNLMSAFPKRFRIFRGADGKPTSFGDDQFRESLDTQLNTLV